MRHDLPALKARLLADLAGLDAAETLADHDGPPRLINALAHGLAPGLTVAQALADRGTFARAMLRWPNVGRRSIAQARAAFRRAVMARYSQTGWPAAGDAAFALLEGGVPGTEELDLLARALAGQEVAGEERRSESVDDILRQALDDALDFCREVVVRRFGIGRPKQTLEDISLDLDVPRERVRHAVAKAIRALRTRHGEALGSALGADPRGRWREMFGEREVVGALDMGQAMTNLSPWFRLSLTVCGSTISEWLDLYAAPCKGGWARPIPSPPATSAGRAGRAGPRGIRVR